MKDENGIVTRLFGTAQDITERKLAEEERLRLSSILEATSDFVGITAVDQRIVFLNKAGRKAMQICDPSFEFAVFHGFHISFVLSGF